MSEERFLLIDGHHLFHRTYNALPRSIVGRDGAPIQGVHGFAGKMRPAGSGEGNRRRVNGDSAGRELSSRDRRASR
ncbi:MAG: hypothetical protein ACRDGS_11600 [Chloroflexota bacterium]